MKSPKPIVTKAVLGTVTTSMLVASCSKDYNLQDNIYGSFADNQPRGAIMVDITKSNLSEEFLQKIESINFIVEDIITNRKSARKFSQNPSNYLAEKEASFDLHLTDKDLQIIHALIDEDLIQAVKDKDFEKFLKVGYERGYIGIINKDDYTTDDIKAMFKSDEDYRQFVMALTGDPDAEIAPATAVATFYLFAVAVVVQYAAAATIAAVEIGAGIQIGAVYDVASWVTGPESTMVKMTVKDREPVLKIWTDSNELINDTAFYDDLIGQQVETITEAIIKQFPDANRDVVENILTVNIQGYYGLRK